MMEGPAREPLGQAMNRQIAEALDVSCRTWGLPGIAAGVRCGATTAVSVSGVTSIATHEPVTEGTRFRAASVTKLFTATAVMRLVERGLLDLDRPLATYLQTVPLRADIRQRLTLRHALSHQTGFESDPLHRVGAEFGEGEDALARLVDRFGELTQWIPPGTTYCYGNHGFDLVGRVLEQVAGQPYEQVIADQVLAPLGLAQSGFLPYGATGDDIAVGHRVDRTSGDASAIQPYGTPRCANPSGGLVTTASDLLRFAEVFLGTKAPGTSALLSESSIDEMTTVISGGDEVGQEHGLGWALHGTSAERRLRHTGTHPGFKSVLTVVPAADVAVVIMANGDSGMEALPGLETRLLHEVAGLPPLPVPPVVPIPRPALERLTGSYGTGGTSMLIRFNGQRLVLDPLSPSPSPLGQAMMALEPVAPDRFRVQGGTARMANRTITFTQVSEAPYSGMYLYLGQHLHRHHDPDE